MSIHRLDTEVQAYLFENALNEAGDAILITDALSRKEGGPHIIFANRTFYETTGFTKEDVLGKTPRILQGKDTNKQALRRISVALATGKPIREELVNYRKDGTLFFVELAITPIVNENGIVTNFVGVQRDITLRKQKEEAIRAKEVAEEVLNFRSLFFTKMNHELRNPLNGILGTAELLANQTAQSTDTGLYERIILLQQAAKQLNSIIKEMLLINEPENKNNVLNITSVAIRTVIKQVVALFEPIARKAEKELTITFQPEVPLMLETDEVKYIQILSNLLSNAIKYATDRLIRIGVSYENDMLRTEVYNDSPPLSASEISKLFQPYSRLSSQSEGMGLGLVIAKQLTESLGGHIGIIPSEKGNTFFFTIKHQTAVVASDEHIATLTEEDMSIIKSHHLRVLIADDHALSLRVSVMLLKFFGCDVTECQDGKEVLTTYPLAKYDLIILDIVMPSLDGLETLQLLRKQYVHLPVIVGLSANAMPDQVKAYLNSGFDYFLSKPIEKNILGNFLMKIINRKQE